MKSNVVVEQCDNHPQIDAIAVCEVCGKFVCGDCAVTKNGLYYCDERTHQTVFEQYDFFGESQNIFAIEVVVKNLEANGIGAVWFNRQQYSKEKNPLLFVLKGMKEQAHAVLQSLDLLDFLVNENHVR